jgi:hypothetical protein
VRWPRETDSPRGLQATPLGSTKFQFTYLDPLDRAGTVGLIWSQDYPCLVVTKLGRCLNGLVATGTDRKRKR